jgi:DNA polymerase-3 subunit alpha
MTIGQLAEAENIKDGETVTIAGLLTSVQHKVARASGNPYGALTLEDFDGEMSVMLMGKTYAEFGRNLQPDQLVVVRGRVSNRDDSKNINAYSIETIEGAGDEIDNSALVLQFKEIAVTAETLEELSRILEVYPGHQEVHIRMVNDEGERLFALKQRVKQTGDLVAELKIAFGASVIAR